MFAFYHFQIIRTTPSSPSGLTIRVRFINCLHRNRHVVRYRLLCQETVSDAKRKFLLVTGPAGDRRRNEAAVKQSRRGTHPLAGWRCLAFDFGDLCHRCRRQFRSRSQLGWNRMRARPSASAATRRAEKKVESSKFCSRQRGLLK